VRIDGLTEEQCKMLDVMWTLDTAKELYSYFQTLTPEKYQMAVTLQEMLIQECEEEKTKNITEAKIMLQNIGVKC